MKAYKVYKQRRPAVTVNSDSHFYLGMKKKFETETEWFYTSNLGKNTINTIAKTMGKDAGIEKRLTNHSARRTVIQQLRENDVHPLDIIQLTGHKNIEGLKPYDKTSDKKKNEIQNMISSKINSATSNDVNQRDDQSSSISVLTNSSINSVSNINQPSTSQAFQILPNCTIGSVQIYMANESHTAKGKKRKHSDSDSEE